MLKTVSSTSQKSKSELHMLTPTHFTYKLPALAEVHHFMKVFRFKGACAKCFVY